MEKRTVNPEEEYYFKDPKTGKEYRYQSRKGAKEAAERIAKGRPIVILKQGGIVALVKGGAR